MREEKLEKSLKAAMFRPNPTARYQGYQGPLYIGYHELSHLASLNYKLVFASLITLKNKLTLLDCIGPHSLVIILKASTPAHEKRSSQHTCVFFGGTGSLFHCKNRAEGVAPSAAKSSPTRGARAGLTSGLHRAY